MSESKQAGGRNRSVGGWVNPYAQLNKGLVVGVTPNKWSS